MLKRFFIFFLFAAFVVSGTFLSAQDEESADTIPAGQDEVLWYRSNPSGMALELLSSRLAALHNEYCLSVGQVRPGELPEILFPYYDEITREPDSRLPLSIELRILYENGKELRRQWIFRDNQDFTRLTTSGTGSLFNGQSPAGIPAGTPSATPAGIPAGTPAATPAGAAEAELPEEAKDAPPAVKQTGFIEIMDNTGSVTRELSFDDDLSEWEYRFFYKGSALIRAESWFKESPPPAAPSEDGAAPEEDGSQDAATPAFVPVTVDYYHYTRSGSLRAIDRNLKEGAEGNLSRISFPRLGPDISSGEELVTQGIAYTSDFLQDIYSPEGAIITYTFDSRGRALTEVWKDKDGAVLGEFRNTWSGDRLASVLWKSNDDERLVQYDYDDNGNRIVERNFRQGVLERTVTSRDGKDTEEIYMNGILILRVYWENGVKVSEERISGGRGKPQ